jgi:hypothetical protein
LQEKLLFLFLIFFKLIVIRARNGSLFFIAWPGPGPKRYFLYKVFSP